MKSILGALFILIGLRSEAKVFTPGSANFGAYVKGLMGPKVENTLVTASRGANADTFDPYHTYNFAAEFGFSWGGENVGSRFGIEILRPPQLTDHDANNGTDNVYKVTGEVSAIIPKLEFEINLKKWTSSKAFLLLGIGYATLVARNAYTVTAAGQAAYPGVTDFAEDLRSTAMMYEIGAGFEDVMTDSNTYFIEAGYRMLKFTSITHNKDAVTFGGSVAKGAAATNLDGSARTLNLSNVYAAAGLRFWLR